MGKIVKNIKKSTFLIAIFLMMLGFSGCKNGVDVNGTLELEGDGSTEQEEDKTEHTTETETETKTETEELIPEVSIMAIGDNLMHVSISYSGLQEDGSWDFSGLFENIKSDIDEADVSILCQEVIMGGIELGISTYPSFNTVQEVGHSIVAAGFDVAVFANNHTFDKGTKGIFNTISFWKKNYPDFCYTGIYESQEERDTISIIEKNGIKIAILNYTYDLNGNILPEGKQYLVNLLSNEEQMIADIQKAKEEADFVIVMPHWGTEYSFTIDTSQKRLTKLYADLGVDLVIGSHPHVVQPVQWIEREGYENPMLIYYSLGNFVSNQRTKERMIGGMAKVTIQKQNGKTVISDHSMDILVTHYESHYGEVYHKNNTTYKMEDYTRELAARHAVGVGYDNSFSYEALKELEQQILQNVE